MMAREFVDVRGGSPRGAEVPLACLRSHAVSWRTIALLTCLTCLTLAQPAPGQQISNTSRRPFVVGIIPVIGRNGAVGGVSIDAKGALVRAALADQKGLQKAQMAARAQQPGRVDASPLRKVSLRGLNDALVKHAKSRKPLTADLLYLAGLQRVQYVFVYPKERDIVIAGPAETWTFNKEGAPVGAKSGRPLLQLTDLLVAIRAAAAPGREPMTCSIDPSPEGVARFQQLTSRPGFRVSQASVAQMERAVGQQNVTIGGVPADSRFARVMVAADYRMKRLAMGLEKPPAGVRLPSYLQLAAQGGPITTALPRWWLTPRFGSLVHDESLQAWQLEGVTVEAQSNDPASAKSPVSDWAQRMTDNYSALSEKQPVFADLRNCMDWAVFGALLQWQDMPGVAKVELPMLLGEEIQPAPLNAATKVPSQASLIRQGRNWIVSVSGGVSFDAWDAIKRVRQDRAPTAVRATATTGLSKARSEGRWWWD